LTRASEAREAGIGLRTPLVKFLSGALAKRDCGGTLNLNVMLSVSQRYMLLNYRRG